MDPNVPVLLLYARNDAFGDGLFRIPALRAARTAFPDARIIYGCSRTSTLTRPLNRHVRHLVDEFRTETGLLDIVKDHRKSKWIGIADFRALPPRQVAAWMGLIGSGIQYEANIPGFVLSLRFGKFPEARPEHNAWRYHRLIERMAGRQLPFDHRLDIPEAARALARNIRGDDTRPLILMCGNSAEDKKRMTSEQAAAIGGILIDKGFRFFYLETEGPGPSGRELAVLDPRITVIGASLGLESAMLDDVFLALGEMAEAYVGIEGGMGHLLATVMTPVVVINHGIRIERWRPMSNFVEVVDANKDGIGGAISTVRPAAVVDATLRLVSARRRDHGPR